MWSVASWNRVRSVSSIILSRYTALRRQPDHRAVVSSTADGAISVSTSRQPVSWQVRARPHVATADASHHAELQSAKPGRLAPGHIWTQALPGRRDQIRAARIFVHEALGNTPVADDAV